VIVNGAEAQFNTDLYATCAQVSIAALIVVGIDAEAMHLAARGISEGRPRLSIRDRLAPLRRRVQRLIVPVLAVTMENVPVVPSEAAGLRTYQAFEAAVRDDEAAIKLIDSVALLGLVAAASTPFVALVCSILGLWRRTARMEGLVATTTILAVVLVAVLLVFQIRIRSRRAAPDLAGSRPAPEPTGSPGRLGGDRGRTGSGGGQPGGVSGSAEGRPDGGGRAIQVAGGEQVEQGAAQDGQHRGAPDQPGGGIALRGRLGAGQHLEPVRDGVGGEAGPRTGRFDE
jgi:hypothetical protein